MTEISSKIRNNKPCFVYHSQIFVVNFVFLIITESNCESRQLIFATFIKSNELSEDSYIGLGEFFSFYFSRKSLKML